MKLIRKYFPDLNNVQTRQYQKLGILYREWNDKVNLISRKDIDHLYERHVLHSLSISKVIQFHPGTKVLDAGTGGGFPGIPLAIMFPEVKFTLVDSIRKKIMVVNNIIDDLGLNNTVAFQERVESVNEKYDFVISRAVTGLPLFYSWVKSKISRRSFNTLKNGILYLKGGDTLEELSKIRAFNKTFNISEFFGEDFFETKKIVHVY